MSIAKQEFTDAGRSMLGRAQAGEVLTVTKLVVGSGSATQPSDLFPLTQPIVQEHVFNISTKRDYGNGIMLVEGSFRSDQVARAFLERELGVFAHVGNEADRLYSIANVFLSQPDNVDPASPSIHSFKVKLVIDRIPDDKLILQIGPTEAVMGENVGAETVGPGVYKEAAGNVLRFKRIIEGAGMEIRYEPLPDGDAIYIGVSTLKNDLDLYVPMTYVGAPAGALYFPTIQEAHDYLRQFVIPTDKFARIFVDKGTFQHSGIEFSHPNSRQISLIGRPPVRRPITSVAYLDATHKNVTVADQTGFVQNQFVYIAGTQTGWVGGCKITAQVRAGSPITCSVEERFPCNRPVYNTPSAAIGFLCYHPTVVQWDNPTPGQRSTGTNMNFPYGIKLVENICAVEGFFGFHVWADGGFFRNCMAYGNKTGVHGFGMDGGATFLQGENIATDFENGFDGSAPWVHLGDNSQMYVNGCGVGIGIGRGVAVAAINPAYVNAWCYINHCACAGRGWTGAGMSIGHVIYQNCDLGFDIAFGSILLIGALTSISANNRLDLKASGMSYIKAAHHPSSMPSCDPPAGTTGNSNSLIDLVVEPSREIDNLIAAGFKF